MRVITEYDLAMPEGWHPLPVTPADQQWASVLAQQIIGGAETIEEAPELLARQLLEVKAAVDATQVTGTRTAVLVTDPTTPFLDAMFTIVLGRGTSPEKYDAQLERVVDEVDTAQVMGRQTIEGEVPGGKVRGAQFLIGHLPADEFTAGAHLEERVHLGVFPEDTSDMVDVTIIAANAGLFTDLPATAVGMLQNLTVRTEGAA
ncbi:hypothetical protein ACFQBY_07345 [Promicromonospora citrea]|uniref:Uncharacterized protein n=1 Tax=Promicromonospora citrea TaxID=43677 RepID=A0A8H9L4Q5_9MICO|nr:hypothetical protein [Promicromonospora citrea]NNH51337.1 hypothetical protein [Promicromonospora citrea]GGM33741.1 hypothetical protein GCM10010102_31640 [Promicromonospora citrea]